MNDENVMTLEQAKRRLLIAQIYKAIVIAKSDFYYAGRDEEIKFLEQFISVLESKQ